MLLRILFILSSLCILSRAQVNNKENEVNVEPELENVDIEVLHKPKNCPKTSSQGDLLYVHYNGTLENGKVFDENNDSGGPFKFTLGTGQVIKGWEIGFIDMCEGEARRLKIPPHLGYGEKGGFGVNIPPNATLFFDVKLLLINEGLDLDQLYQQLDANSDNLISGDEMAVQINADLKQSGEDLSKVNEIVAEIMQVQDQDKDGYLSKEEFIHQTHDEL